AEAPETSEQRQARVRKLLDEARQQSEHPPETVPAGIDPSELAQRRDALLKLTVAYDIQLRALDQLERAKLDRRAAATKARDWTGFDTPPPYSILKVDELREAADITRDRIALIDAGIAQLRLDGARAQDELKRAEETSRLAEDALASASGPEQ